MTDERSSIPVSVALVSNTDESLYRFRLPIIRALVSRGVSVFAIAPPGRFVGEITDAGAVFVAWDVRRGSFNVFREVRSVVQLVRVYRMLRPRLVHHFTVKPNIYGAMAARLAGVPMVVATVTGLGYLFIAKGLVARGYRTLVSTLYRLSVVLSDEILFQNDDDIGVFRKSQIIRNSTGVLLHGGSGVDTRVFDPQMVGPTSVASLRTKLGLLDNVPVVVLVARMLWHKGVQEFVDCARLLRERCLAYFLLVGPIDRGNPACVPEEQLDVWTKEGSVQYIGAREDIRELMSLADVVVLPSYREGTPRVLLEAAAMARAVVATDVPGCRQVVEPFKTGLLVPPSNAGALANAVEQLLVNPDLRLQFGETARRKAIIEFDDSRIVEQVLGIYQSILSRKNPPLSSGE